MFSALILERKEKEIQADIREIAAEDLPQEEVLVEVKYSSVNYKDALAVTGEGKIVRGSFPFVPGIDLVGEVVASESPDFTKGDRVIGNGWGLGEADWGGYAQMACVKSKMLIPLPEGMSYKHAMTFGTAGFTAMLSVMSLEEHGTTPERGEVVVTGATGGVGSISIVLLSQLGYDVVASSGKAHAHAYLKELGASRIIGRSELGDGPARALDKGKWAGAIDNVGGPALSALISQMKRHGSIASCGLASSHALETTVYPFILRGVNLLGIDSSTCTHDRRIKAWQRLAAIPASVFDGVTQVIPLADVPSLCKKMMESNIQGRFVVDVNR
ncbi:MAG: MDR family oxidoreductase [Rhodothermales bacterium]